MDEAKQQSEQISGISNVAYDLMAVMTNKLEGIAANDKRVAGFQVEALNAKPPIVPRAT